MLLYYAIHAKISLLLAHWGFLATNLMMEELWSMQIKKILDA